MVTYLHPLDHVVSHLGKPLPHTLCEWVGGDTQPHQITSPYQPGLPDFSCVLVKAWIYIYKATIKLSKRTCMHEQHKVKVWTSLVAELNIIVHEVWNKCDSTVGPTQGHTNVHTSRASKIYDNYYPSYSIIREASFNNDIKLPQNQVQLVSHLSLTVESSSLSW